jgi:hypothetical protein
VAVSLERRRGHIGSSELAATAMSIDKIAVEANPSQEINAIVEAPCPPIRQAGRGERLGRA